MYDGPVMYHRGVGFTVALFFLAVIGGQGCARANGVSAPIESGKTVSGTLSGTGADIYTFKTKKGGSVVLTVSEAGPHDDNFFLQMEITGPGNNQMGGGGKPGLYRQIMNNVEEGDWSVKISDGGTVSGKYNFTVLRVPGVTGTKVKFGQEYKGTIKGGSLDVYRISGTPGVSVDVNLTPANDKFDIAFLFFDPSGANSGGGGCAGQCSSGMQFTAYGDYIMMVGADDSGGGPAESAYTLSVTREGDSVPGQQAQQSAQASAQPPPPPAPQPMTVEQVFENPVMPIYTDRVLPASGYPVIYEDGMILSFNEDYLVRDAERHNADEGSPLAQLHTGDDYFKATPKQAVDDFWVKAADQGNADARNRLGLTYARFHPDQSQKYKTADWYLHAIAQGAIDAPVKIVNLYHGTEHPQNDAEIVKLATGYAEKGVPEAQYVLGVAYETGQGVKQDYATAESWYRKAAEKGNRNAEYAIGNIYYHLEGSLYRDGHGVNQVESEQHDESVKWFRLASDHGVAAAQFHRAAMYLSGYGESNDFAKARALYQRAGDQGLAAAQYNLAVMYAHGIGGETDYASAGQWYAKAAAQGLILAQNDLGELIEHGAGFAQDYAAAAKWYRLAADAGYPAAQYNLARLYRDGHGVAKDTAQATAWFTKAAAAGSVEAQADLDNLNAAAGRPEAQNDEMKILRTVAAQGDNDALQKLIEIYRVSGIKKDDYDNLLALYRDAATRLNPVAFAGLADLFARKDPPDDPEAYFWYRLASVSAEKWRAFPDEKDTLKKYADGEAAKISGKLLPEQIAVAQWRIADRSPPAPDKRQLEGAEFYIKADLAEKQGDYSTAKQYYVLADHDDLGLAADKLGRLFEHGTYVTRNMSRAIGYFKKAVRNGRVGPATWLGDIYLYGISVPADMKEAAKWYQMDADRGYPRAINTLGWIYLSGEKNAESKAIAMYEKAAVRTAQSYIANGPYDALGMIYFYGIGVTPDTKKALNWYQKSGDQTGLTQTSLILISPELHDYSRAFKLLGHIVDPVMYNNIGYLYEQGLGVHDSNHYPGQAHPNAMEFYKKASDMCYGRAMYHIGRLYQSGVNDPAIAAEPIPKDPAMARKWMEMAAHYGSSAAVDWLKGEDRNDPSPKAAIEPEVNLPVEACGQRGGQ